MKNPFKNPQNNPVNINNLNVSPDTRLILDAIVNKNKISVIPPMPKPKRKSNL